MPETLEKLPATETYSELRREVQLVIVHSKEWTAESRL